MSQIGFYHLTRSSLIQALPQLLIRTLAAGQRAIVLCPSEDIVTELNTTLWEAAATDWLPHGAEQDGDADLQPIWLSADTSAPNGAKFLFLVEGASTERLGSFERVFDLFDGQKDAAVAAARMRWTAARDAGHTLVYWQQGPRGWEKKQG